MRGRFITFEGIEGAGKSTLIKRIAAELVHRGFETFVTREPGATELGNRIREIVLDPAASVPPETELLLFLADRSDHVSSLVRPALERGAIVLCDRYLHSTLAYQGFGRGMEVKTLKALNEFATKGLIPDLLLLLDIPPGIGLNRAKGRKDEAGSWNRFEQQELDFHERVRRGFLALVRDGEFRGLAGRAEILDGSVSADELFRKGWEATESFLGSFRATEN